MTSALPNLPFLPFSKPTIDEATIAAVGEVLRSGWITSGPKVAAFEAQLSEYFGGRPVRTFNSGTCTMEIALRIAGIGAGDEVITTSISWVATANVIIEVGATPVFADIDPVTRNIDLDKVEAAITPRTKAIIPVYLSGLPVDMDRLYAIAKKYNLRVIEDAAQAFGSEWKGKRIGSFGDFVSFSFQANKNLTTGEGGCLVLNNAEEARLAEKYRLQGVTRTGVDGIDVDVLGGKYNMTDITAAIGWDSSPISSRSPRTAARWRAITSRSSAPTSRRSPARSCRWPISRTATGICSRLFCPTMVRARARASCRRWPNSRSAPATTTRPSTCSPCTRSAASRKACSRSPKKSAA